MNTQLQSLLQIIRNPIASLVPGLKIDVSEPFHPTGVWIINLFAEDYHLMIQYTEERGFGLTAGDDDWGTSVDEVISEAGAAAIRVWELLITRGRTIPITTLQRLRAEKSQREIAEAMHIKQPSYARMESEELSKLKVQTLKNIVAATEGKLHLLVETQNGQYFILTDSLEKKNKKNNSKEFTSESYENVPRHLVNLSSRKENNSHYKEVFKNAYTTSAKFHFGENIKLMWPDNFISEKSNPLDGYLFHEPLYYHYFFNSCTLLRKNESNLEDRRAELRLIK